MIHRTSVIAGTMLVVCLSPLAAATASAQPPEERRAPEVVVPRDPPAGHLHNYPKEPDFVTPPTASTTTTDDDGVAALLASCTAVAGASLALGGVHLYKRRRTETT
ncbi:MULTISPECIES: hypothetical protein [unclassified Kribbella]|uniref:hypothetical protein n=1 Tax=unclassified Kribbella TaxID=2644121 RepID=UPI0033F5D8CC